jgi:hypothetical protein
MTWIEALDVVVSRTKHERFRELCDESHPDHLLWRDKIVELSGLKPRPQYPSLASQAHSLALSLWTWAKTGLKLATNYEARRRQAICHACPLYRPDSNRCGKCGCSVAIKPWLNSATCPEVRW